MAHLGGFLATYLTLPLVARGGPVATGVVDGGPSGLSTLRGRRDAIKSSMVNLTNVDDPWTARGLPVPKRARGVLTSLYEASDEPETRLAWFEQLAAVVRCPECAGDVGVVERKNGPRLQCADDPQHLDWPPNEEATG